MNKVFKYMLIILLCLSFSSCKNNNYESKENKNELEEVEYPTYSISEYLKMDKYDISKTINEIKYKYTFFFKEDMCVNSKEELLFKSKDSAKKFYDENEDNNEYMKIDLNDNVVTYFYNPEYFEYMMYPKNVLIELLNSMENDE